MAMSDRLPVLLEPEQLLPILTDESLLIVDLCKPESYAKGHIAGAVHVDYRHLQSGSRPAAGKLPGVEQLSALFSSIGLNDEVHVVAYDDEGGGWAGRFLWTLDVIGHPHGSVLNGGIIAWGNEGYPVTAEIPHITTTSYSVATQGAALVTKDEIIARLEDPSLALLDARTPEEFDGSKIRAAKRGHIPGAANLNWTDTMDKSRGLRLLPDDELRKMLSDRNIRADQEVIAYCHTHHRSSHSYLMLKHLGYQKIRGYAGSWSEWGNDPDTPVEL